MQGELQALAASLSTITSIAKTMVDLRDAAKLNSIMIELQGAILEAQSHAMSAQQEHFSLSDRVKELEKECMRLKDWSAEKQNYALQEVAIGIFAYVQDATVQPGSSTKKFCANCFDSGKKSLLQEGLSAKPGRKRELTCHGCGKTVDFYSYKQLQ